MRLTRSNSLALDFISRNAGALPPSGPTAVAFVAASRASTPPNLSTDFAGTTVVVPVPAGVLDGDVLLCGVSWQSGAAPTAPAGWTLLITVSGFMRVYSRVAAAEPASYTWTAFSSGTARGGVMTAHRYAAIGDTASSANTSAVQPTVTAGPVAGAAYVGFADFVSTTNNNGDTATAPLTMRTQHSMDGTVAYQLPNHIDVASQEGLSSSEVVSGRDIVGPDDPNGDRASIILDFVAP